MTLPLTRGWGFRVSLSDGTRENARFDGTRWWSLAGAELHPVDWERWNVPVMVPNEEEKGA